MVKITAPFHLHKKSEKRLDEDSPSTPGRKYRVHFKPDEKLAGDRSRRVYLRDGQEKYVASSHQPRVHFKSNEKAPASQSHGIYVPEGNEKILASSKESHVRFAPDVKSLTSHTHAVYIPDGQEKLLITRRNISPNDCRSAVQKYSRVSKTDRSWSVEASQSPVGSVH